MDTNSSEHRELSDFQQKYLKEVSSFPLRQPYEPWKLAQVICREYILCIGWTKESNLLIVEFDGYEVIDLMADKQIIKVSSNISNNLSQGNNFFDVPELNELVNVFGIYGGDGNQVCSDGWKIGLVYPFWPNAAVYMKPQSSKDSVWENMRLLELDGMEYYDLKCGFSPNESMFLVSNLHGVNIFKR